MTNSAGREGRLLIAMRSSAPWSGRTPLSGA